MRWSLIPVALLALTLTACPEERPGATKEIPPQRVPPAVSIEPLPAGPAAVVPGAVVPGAVVPGAVVPGAVVPGDGGLVSRPVPPARRP